MTAAPVLARSLKFSLQIAQGENLGQVYSFEKPIVLIGRGPQNDVSLANDPKVSRQHVEIRIEAGFLKVSNISDKNFILLNGEKIDHKYIQTSARLQVGDTLIDIKLDLPPAPAPNPSSVAVSVAPVQAPVLTPSSPSVPAQPRVTTAQTYVPPQQATNTYRPPQSANQKNSKIRFYIILVLVLSGLAWFFTGGPGKRKPEMGLRTEGDIVRAIEESAVAVKELKKQQENSGQNSVQYKAAQEHYIKGFRDYRQKQYARAIQSFQATLSFYPAHELAKKYLIQSQRKFEEMIDANMSLGRKYYQRQNYKLCQSSFANVMIMLKDTSKPKYREAKQFYDECSLRLEGRF